MNEKLTDIMAQYDAKKVAADQKEYDYFFKASPEIKEMFYQYWLKNKDMDDSPQYLKDYAEAKKYD